MKKSLATIPLLLAIGLTVPAWAQHRAGAGAEGGARLGQSSVSTSSATRLGANARANQPGVVKGSAQASSSTNAKVKGKNKKQSNANADVQAGASANVPAIQVKSDTSANIGTNAKLSTDAGAKVDANANAKASTDAQAQTSPH